MIPHHNANTRVKLFTRIRHRYSQYCCGGAHFIISFCCYQNLIQYECKTATNQFLKSKIIYVYLHSGTYFFPHIYCLTALNPYLNNVGLSLMRLCWGIHLRAIILFYEFKIHTFKTLTHLPGASELTHMSLCAAYMSQWIGSALVQIMVCRLVGAKPLSTPLLEYCQLNHWKYISVRF